MNGARGELVVGGWFHGENDAKIARKLQSGPILEARALKKVEIIGGALGQPCNAVLTVQFGSLVDVNEPAENRGIGVQVAGRMPKHQDFVNQYFKASNCVCN